MANESLLCKLLKGEIFNAAADLLTMGLMQSDESNLPSPGWKTIEQVFAALEAPLLRYAQRLVSDPSQAEDLVQDAFMKLHTQFQQVRTPQAWLYRTVHNLAVDYQRRANKIVLFDPANKDQPQPQGEANDSPALPDEEIARWERIGLVRLVLETLDARSQELVRLRFNEDLSYKEISGRTGLSEGNVGYILHHALKAMAVELSKTELTS